ncbi:hypothetical protein like AT4G19900 [Hibiscus trionum]|uniref:Alpha 1,4-glycosyltransferase domain-containing protein n=1 Tax=Hibiscus trionum TaxID=183268 RepID=A0A9W7I721_HIBTR|nr:hypothetical protein like AT4G19900 [Hibiscus trionum]
MIRNLRSRRRPRYGAQVCAVISALLLLFSVSILYTRLSLSSKPDMYPHHSYVDDGKNDDAVFPTIPLLSDSEDVATTTTSSSTDDKIDEFDTLEENDITDDDNGNEVEQEELGITTMSKKDKIFSSGHFYFDHLSGSIRRAFNKRSIQDWDYDGGFLSDGFGGDDDKIKAAFGSDDIPLDEEVRRKMAEVESIEDALLVKKVAGRKVNPLREKWGDWFEKKSDFLRRDRMFKSNLDILNPLNNPLLQDPDGVGVTGLTKGDKMVQKWILSEFTKVPFTGKKPLGISETGSEVKKGSVSKKNENARNVLTERESSSIGKDDLSSNTNRNESRNRKNEVKNVDLEAHKNTKFSGHIYADGERWGYYPGLDSRLSFTDFVEAFFKKGKCDIRVFMIWNSPPWRYSVRHQRGLESLLAQHRDACVLVFSETIELDFFKDSFVKDGYKVAVAMPNLDELLKDTPTHVFASVWFEWRKTKFYATHYSELVRLAALYKYGGIYLDSDIIVLKPLLALNNTVGQEDQGSSLNGALMAFRKHSPFIMECLKEFYMTYDDTQLKANGAGLLSRVAKRFLNKDISIKQPELNVQTSSVFFPISSRHITRYFVAPMTETEKSQQDVLFNKILTESVTFHFWNSVTSSLIPEPESLAARIINHPCIHCSELL